MLKAFWRIVIETVLLPRTAWRLLRAIYHLFKDSLVGWNRDNGALLSAALAFFTIFSLAPVLVIGISIAGLVFGEPTAEKEIIREAEMLVGEEAAEMVHQLVKNSLRREGNLIALVIGVGAMLFGASWVFTHMKDALNTIWNVPKPPRGVRHILLNRVIGFFVAVSTGLLVVISLIINAVLAGLRSLINTLLPDVSLFWQVAYFAVSLGLFTLLFALLFKILPDAHITWDDVWIGAVVTAILFELGRYLIGLYLNIHSVGSSYGAAGSLVIILLWVYFSAQIFLFGAEFTHVYACRYGSQIVPRRTLWDDSGREELEEHEQNNGTDTPCPMCDTIPTTDEITKGNKG
jgi:membrane protein